MSSGWIKRRAPDEESSGSSSKKQKTIHHPPFLPESKHGEWDTAETAGELMVIFEEKKEEFENKYVEVFPSEWGESLTALVGPDHAETMTKVIFEYTHAEFEETLKRSFQMVRDYVRLCEDARKIHDWIESREPHHFQDDVNDEDSIRGEIYKLEETIGAYWDDVLPVVSVMDTFQQMMDASSSLYFPPSAANNNVQESVQDEGNAEKPE